MKANEAPEKIYLIIDPVWGSMNVNYNRNDTNNIEYVRTDTFIEKVCEWLEKNIAEATGIDSYVITESFKQAMKDE